MGWERGPSFGGKGAREGLGLGWLETNLASRWEGVRLPRASGKSPDFPRSSPHFPGSFRKFFGNFTGSSLTVELYSNPEVPRKFPRLPRKFPRLPRKFPGLPRRSAPFSGKLDTLFWLTKTWKRASLTVKEGLAAHNLVEEELQLLLRLCFWNVRLQRTWLQANHENNGSHRVLGLLDFLGRLNSKESPWLIRCLLSLLQGS